MASSGLSVGLDAGAVIALGGQSPVTNDVRPARARAGRPMTNGSRWSPEPTTGSSSVAAEGVDACLFHDLAAGALDRVGAPVERTRSER